MKTLIELFDTDMLENVISCIAFKPERVVFIGFDIPAHKRQDIEATLRKNGVNTKCEYIEPLNRDLDELVSQLVRIIGNNPDCMIELGGGDEVLAAAVGVAASQTDTPIFRYDINNNRTVKIYKADSEEIYPLPEMAIEDYIRLFGGAVDRTKSFQHWNITAEFEKDIMGLWRIFSQDTIEWNCQTAIIAMLDEYDSDSRPEWVYVDRDRLVNKKIELDRRVISQLSDGGYISGFKSDKNKIMFRYKNSQVRAILRKTGNLLELYTYIAARGLEMAGKKCFNDIRIGVFIDWDGVIHSSGDAVKDTANEVDVAAMCGVMPVFISCKSGEVKKEALYELETIAERFGGKYAKKILVMTDMRGIDAKAHLKQRAKDMGIVLIENLHKKSMERFRKELLTAIQ